MHATTMKETETTPIYQLKQTKKQTKTKENPP